MTDPKEPAKPKPRPPPTEIPTSGKPIRERLAKRTVVVGGPGDPPRRVALSVLGTLVREIEEAVRVVSNDLGAPDLRRVDLVDLLGHSSGLVLEQPVPESYHGELVPLEVVVDGAASYFSGHQLPPILTEEGASAIVRFARSLEDIASAGPSIAVLLPDGQRVAATVREGPLHAEKDASPEVAINEGRGDQVSLPKNEWLVTFTGTLERLDSKRQLMWVRVRRYGMVQLSLSEGMFKAADADDARWQNVTVVSIATESNPKATRDVVHITPFDGGNSEVVAIPIGEAATGVSDTISAIEELSHLEARWCGDGSVAIQQASIKLTVSFLLLAAVELRARNMEIIEPFVVPVPNGNAQLEWERGSAYLDMEFHHTGRIEYLRSYENEVIEGRATRETALRLVLWFHERVQT